MSEVTRILGQIEAGDPSAAKDLLPLVYDELRKLAAAKMARERPDHSLQATALVHEAYLRLVDGKQARNWDSHGHFFAAAAEAMRRILIENARRKKRARHGGGRQRVSLDEAALVSGDLPDDVLAIDDAIEKLAAEDPQGAELVKLRYFAGLSVEQAGEMLGLARSTAYDRWAYARAWMWRQLRDEATDADG